jgi:hypothetical protein
MNLKLWEWVVVLAAFITIAELPLQFIEWPKNLLVTLPCSILLGMAMSIRSDSNGRQG